MARKKSTARRSGATRKRAGTRSPKTPTTGRAKTAASRGARKKTAGSRGASKKTASRKAATPKKAAAKAPRRPPGKAGPVDKVIGAGAAVGGAIAGTVKDVAQKILP